MATQKKNSTSRVRKNTASKGNSSTKRYNKASSVSKRKVIEDDFNEELVNEIIIIGVIAVAILLFLCNFGILGTFGNLVSSFMFGLFGLFSYIIPIMATYIIFFAVANSGNRKVLRRNLALCDLYLNCAMACELFQNQMSYGKELVDFKSGLKENWTFAYENHKGGGLFGGLLANICVKYLGTVGTVFLIIVFIIICIVLITERSLFNGIKGASYASHRAIKRSAESARNSAILYNEKKSERRERSLERKERLRQIQLEEQRNREEIKKTKAEERKLREEEIENNKILKMTEVSGTPTFTFVREEDLIKERDDIHEINLADINSRVENPDSIIRIHGIENESGEVSNSDEIEELYFNDNIFANVKPIENSNDINSHNVISEVNSTDLDSNNLNTSYGNSFERNNYEDDDLISDGIFNDKSVTNKPEEDLYSSDAINEIHFDREDKTSANSVSVRPEIKQSIVNEGSGNNVSSDSIFKSGHSNPTNGGRTFGTTSGTAADIEAPKPVKKVERPYKIPPISLLKEGTKPISGDKNELMQTARKLEDVLSYFNVKARVSDVSQGPAVTRYEMIPEPGVKVSKILGLSDDLKLNLAAADIRIEAPIPGKAAIGIEVPNKESSAVALRDLIDSKEFKSSESKLSFAVGKDLTGKVIVTDIAKMPHMLIAGATGSGKSVCINTLIMSILYKAKPDEVKMIMIDPKVVELSVYNGIPHLLIPVVTDPKKANASLAWAVKEMDNRYLKFAELGVRDLKGYNAKIENEKDNDGNPVPKMYQLVVIVDELADLMMVAGKEVEESICRLAQLARAAGIHLIIATQRPSVDVITGLIKANMPSRISFAVSSGVDSRTILDMVGAEKLLGKGDMLFYPQGYTKPARVQGAFVSDKEVSDVVDFLRNNLSGTVYVSNDIADQISNMATSGSNNSQSGAVQSGNDDFDEFFYEAGKLITESGKCSIGMLQRKFKIGFNRAARIMDALSEAGVVGPEVGTKPREIMMTTDQFEDYFNNL